MYFFRIIFIISILLLNSGIGYSQKVPGKDTTLVSSNGKDKFVGIGTGMVLPKTDLAPSYQKPGTNFSAVFQFNKRKRLNISFWLNVGKLQSEDRNVAFLDQSEFQINSFASTIYQSIHVEPTFHFLKKENWGVFIAQGFGFFRFDVYDENNIDLSSQLNSRAPGESLPNFTVILPTSLGAYYFFNNNFGLHFKMSLWNTQTDYLDNISTFGNPDNNDNVLNFQLSFLKRFSTVFK